ncbi:MAG: hypothetical protein KI790_08965 [Cyclobacteriaceae bacterium]|nr:hypothetical protein [Cyclobacteriaceae bacterium HetDA_MAG_MS6]
MRQLCWFSVLLIGCYQAPKVDGFDREKWVSSKDLCDEYRVNISALLIKDNSPILSSTQNEVQKLLGSPERHRLYRRNQKIFYYPLSCSGTQELMIIFDALGRAKELRVVEREVDSNSE